MVDAITFPTTTKAEVYRPTPNGLVGRKLTIKKGRHIEGEVVHSDGKTLDFLYVSKGHPRLLVVSIDKVEVETIDPKNN